MLFTNKAFFFQVHGESFIVNLMTGFNHGEEKCKRKKRKREKDKERKRKVKQSTEHLVFFTVDNVWRKEKVEKLNLPVPEETSKDADNTFSPLTLTAPIDCTVSFPSHQTRWKLFLQCIIFCHYWL